MYRVEMNETSGLLGERQGSRAPGREGFLDGQRFDELARTVARSSSRRSLLRAAVGGAGAGVLTLLGVRAAGADDTCKPANLPQSKCNKDAQCCVGLVCGPDGLCEPGCRIDGTFYADGAEEPGNVCRTCQPMVSTVGWSNADGVTCETGNLCTADICSAGACTRGVDVVTATCPLPDNCHQPGVCEPSTGECTYEIQRDGTGCSSGNACKTGERCQTGVCTGGSDVICGTDSTCATYDCDPASGCFTTNTAAGILCAPTTCQGDQEVRTACDGVGSCVAGAPIPCAPYLCNAEGSACRTSCASDSDCQGDAYCDGGTCLEDRAQGTACQRNEQCLSNSCVDGVCCAQASCGTCEACNVAGAVGTCTIAVGHTCTPADACYTSGTCATDGSCTPTVAKVCPELECNSVVCQNGDCQYTPSDFGESCGSGGTECNPTICQSGRCEAALDTTTGDTCGGGTGLCYGGACCQGLTTEAGPCQVGYGACCQNESCCGGACCDHTCWFDVSDGEFCCGTNSSTRCGNTCCFDGRVCHESGGVHTCAFSEQICDNNVLCHDQCCVHSGGQRTCCASGQICSVNGCAAADRTCMSDTDCIPGESCVGGTYRLTEDGPVRETAGECCYGSHICPTGEGGSGDGEAYFCCGSGNYCCGEGHCAGFPDYTCTGCTCSFRAVYPR